MFGSIARGEPTADSDIDLAVIAVPGWYERVAIEDTIRTRLGNSCDVLLFTREEFEKSARDGEPVVSEILRNGAALVGDKPRIGRGAA